MSRILVAIDFSPCSQAAIQAAVQLALDLKAPLRLVHAFPEHLKRPAVALVGFEELFEEIASQTESQEAIQLTSVWAQTARDEGLDVDVAARPVRADVLLLEEAAKPDAALIVMGRSGKGAIRKALVGSVTHEVVKRSPKPVLVVPEA